MLVAAFPELFCHFQVLNPQLILNSLNFFAKNNHQLVDMHTVGSQILYQGIALNILKCHQLKTGILKQATIFFFNKKPDEPSSNSNIYQANT